MRGGQLLAPGARAGVAWQPAIGSPHGGHHVSERLVSFIEQCRTSRDFDALLSQFQDLVRPLGFEYIALLDLAAAASEPLESIVFSTFLPEWITAFGSRDQNLVDPVWQATVAGTTSFLWSHVALEGDAGQSERPLFYRSIGLVDGMTIPVFSPRALRAAMFLGAVRYPHLDPLTEASVTLASSLLAVRALRNRPDRVVQRKLTERECEILTWTALGHSARDISGFLDLSEKTVARHLLNIRLKLSVANTVQAVAVAMREKLIDP